MESGSYIFNTLAIKKLLANKFVIFIGDSVMRSMYKDFVLLLQEDRLLSNNERKTKGECAFLSDELIEGGQMGEMTNGKNYTEVRQYQHPFYLLRFYFVTRVYSPYMETVIADLVTGHQPDIIVINSCLWDITRYGSRSMVHFEMNLQKLCQQLKRLLAPETLVMWTTSMPVAQTIRGGFLIDEISFISEVLRVDVLSANYYASQVVSDHGFDVVDLHYAFRRLTNHRAVDGVHWNGIVHRAITNLLLWHVCDAWHVELPAPNSGSYSSLLNEPQQHQEVPSILCDSSFKYGNCETYSSDYGVRSCEQENRNACQQNVDFTADNCDELDSGFVGFGCYPHIPQQNFSQNRNVCSARNRQFGSDVTNREKLNQPLVAKRRRRDLRNNGRRPY